jgi:hypothetical protein
VASPSTYRLNMQNTAAIRTVSWISGSELAGALDDTSFDAELRREADEALALTGKDVGTPIIHFQSPDGVGFFGPVVSRLPSEAEAVALWDNVLGLASFPGFAELKRRVRERPQLRSFGVEPGQVGVQEDWYAGRRPRPAIAARETRSGMKRARLLQ